ncbi:HNH endonuclease [Vibrio splendidus]|uniref:HNH endonuclease n=1 Tax=Vibrio splendidus TaxID=29497 RepID=UPI0002EF1469|nr:HNH endonuclease [Vibrio splendidus]OEF21991.1 hypothetical protein A145_09835 [Vibrio splendidus 5S-101]PTP81060.1 hypothetical protein CWO00_01045 [Vibrio splendidus]
MKIDDWYLNIKKLPQISRASTDYLATLKPYKAEYWDIATKKMVAYKDELLTKLIDIQKNRCVYCGLSLDNRSIDREHFVHKSEKNGYQEFMFNNDNLFAACEHCNRRLKGTKDVLEMYNINYSKCEFNIIHPYFDNPDDYIEFLPSKDDPVVVRPTKKDNGKGLNTIKMFKLGTQVRWRQRVAFINDQKMDTSRFKEILQHTRK